MCDHSAVHDSHRIATTIAPVAPPDAAPLAPHASLQAIPPAHASLQVMQLEAARLAEAAARATSQKTQALKYAEAEQSATAETALEAERAAVAQRQAEVYAAAAADREAEQNRRNEELEAAARARAVTVAAAERAAEEAA